MSSVFRYGISQIALIAIGFGCSIHKTGQKINQMIFKDLNAIPSWEECCDSCGTYTNCVTWSYKAETRQCSLSSLDDRFQSEPSYVWGYAASQTTTPFPLTTTAQAPAECSRFLPKRDLVVAPAHILGTDRNAQNVRDCAQQCLRESDCVAFDFESSSSTCRLGNDRSGFYHPNSGRSFYERE